MSLQSADSDTVSTYQVSSLQFVADKKLEAFNKPLDCDSTIVLAVVGLGAPATTATHSRVIRLRRVLTDHPLQLT